jgi:cobyrinic acid a,c-diamide synthase
MSSQYRMSYCTVYPSREAGLFPAGHALRGHVFHYSEMIGEPEVAQVYEVLTSRSVSFREGYRAGSVLASYVHLHFSSHPEAASAFVAACRRSREEVLR